MNPIEELLALQEEHGHLEDEVLIELSRRTGTPLYELEGLCTFYPHFMRTPPAAVRVRACRDLACHMRQRESPLDELREACESRPDTDFEAVSCLGRCELAPACTVNDEPMSIAEARSRLAGASIGPPEHAGPSPPGETQRWQIDPYANAEGRYGALAEALASRGEPGSQRRLIDRISESGLRGMGGAGFPTGRKWQIVADQPATPRSVICNADESEPGTFKDRVLMADVPHLVIEGMILAGLAIGSSEGWIFIRHEYGPERESLAAAIEDARARGALGPDIFGSGFEFDIRIFVSPGGYILGEETALLEALEGRRGEPRNKPPFPGVEGLYGRPTLINNVETLAHVPRLLRGASADLKFFSLSGDVERPGVVEVPLGTPLSDLIDRCGGVRGGGDLLAFLPGGPSTGFLFAEHAEIAMDWEPLQEAGSALGSGAVLIVAKGADLHDLATNLSEFFRNESCGKCVPCRIGTEKAVKLIRRGDPSSLELLPELDEVLRATSICGLGQIALTPILSVLARFPVPGSSTGDEP